LQQQLAEVLAALAVRTMTGLGEDLEAGVRANRARHYDRATGASNRVLAATDDERGALDALQVRGHGVLAQRSSRPCLGDVRVDVLGLRGVRGCLADGGVAREGRAQLPSLERLLGAEARDLAAHVPVLARQGVDLARGRVGDDRGTSLGEVE